MMEPEDLRANQRECWAALKAAYEEYKIASAILDSRIGLEESEGPDAGVGEQFRAQQLAFERYMEARMAYLDTCVDKATARATLSNSLAVIPVQHTNSEQPPPIAWPPFAMVAPVLRGLLVALLCVTAFSAVLQQRRTHDLQAAFNELQVRFDQVNESLAARGQVLNASRVLDPSTRCPTQGHLAPVQRHPSGALQAKSGLPPAQAGTPRKSHGKPGHYQFALSPSHQFQRIGPIRVTLIAMDRKRQSADLSISSDADKFAIRRLKPGQLVRIPLRSKALEVVVDRIGPTGLVGHLSDSPYTKPPQLKPPQLKPPQLRTGRLMPSTAWPAGE
jgi:hypothetical protein